MSELQPVKRERPDWDSYFMSLALIVASRSTCISQQVGCVIVKDNRPLVMGYNGVPSGLPHCLDLDYCHYYGDGGCTFSGISSRAIHAEANAIAQAAREGIAIKGAAAYTTHEPCEKCLKLLVACGIEQVFYYKPSLFSSNFKKEVSGKLIELKEFSF